MNALAPLRPLATVARLVVAIGPAHGPIPPGVARTGGELRDFAAQFDDSVEVYSPDPVASIAVLEPLLADGCVVVMFALDGDQHADAALVTDGRSVSARLLGDDGPRLVRPACDVRHLVAFAVAAGELPDGSELR